MTVEADINSSAKGNLLLQADKDVLTAAKGNVGIEAKSDINMVGKNIAVEGNSKITLNGDRHKSPDNRRQYKELPIK